MVGPSSANSCFLSSSGRKYQFCFIFVPDIELNAKKPCITTACQIFTEYFYWEHEVWSFRKYNFQDAIKVASTHIFLRLDLPSTLIRHENGAFRERPSNRRNLKTSVFRFLEHGKSFENGAFQNRCSRDNSVNSLTEFFLSKN